MIHSGTLILAGITLMALLCGCEVKTVSRRPLESNPSIPAERPWGAGVSARLQTLPSVPNIALVKFSGLTEDWNPSIKILQAFEREDFIDVVPSLHTFSEREGKFLLSTSQARAGAADRPVRSYTLFPGQPIDAFVTEHVSGIWTLDPKRDVIPRGKDPILFYDFALRSEETVRFRLEKEVGGNKIQGPEFAVHFPTADYHVPLATTTTEASVRAPRIFLSSYAWLVLVGEARIECDELHAEPDSVISNLPESLITKAIPPPPELIHIKAKRAYGKLTLRPQGVESPNPRLSSSPSVLVEVEEPSDAQISVDPRPAPSGKAGTYCIVIAGKASGNSIDCRSR